jgi:hypothetical protein
MNLTKPNLAGAVVMMLGIASTPSVSFLIPNAAAQTTTARAEKTPKAAGTASPQEASSSTITVLFLSYLHDERMQRELKLTQKQLAKIRNICKEIRAKHKTELENAGPQGGERGLPPPKGLPNLEYSEYWKIQEKIDAEEQQALLKS